VRESEKIWPKLMLTQGLEADIINTNCRPYWSTGWRPELLNEYTSTNSLNTENNINTSLVFERSPVQISVPRPAILTEVLRVLLSPSKQMLGKYLKLGHGRFLPYPFQFIIHWSSYLSTSFLPELVTASLNKTNTWIQIWKLFPQTNEIQDNVRSHVYLNPA
jgi:hypothetical protein